MNSQHHSLIQQSNWGQKMRSRRTYLSNNPERTKKATTSAVVITLMLGVGLAAGPAIAAQAAGAWPCNNVGASVSAVSGRVRGTGTWNCGVGYGSATYGTEVHVFHNYDFLPDADVFYGAWILTGSTSNTSRSVQRCDQSTTADYYSQARIPAFNSPWVTSGLMKITTCAGTGS